MDSVKTNMLHQDFQALHRDVVFGKSHGRIIWQPRILCWYTDRMFRGEPLPAPYTGMTLPELYRALGCSNRIYDYNGCFQTVEDPRVVSWSKNLSEREILHGIDTPVGQLTCVMRSNSSNYGEYPVKWWVTKPEELQVVTWLEEHRTWRWDQEYFDRTKAEWGDLGAPTIFLPRVNVLSLYNDWMGIENGVFALLDYPDETEAFFKVQEEYHERLIRVVNDSPIEIVNFGDNVHAGTLSLEFFKRYVQPCYLRRNELLHQAGKFTTSHWDGDVKALLPHMQHCGFDGLEALTPVPQGDITVEEMKQGLGDSMYLLDGIAALLFDERYPVSALIEQVEELIERFAPRLVLGISDEMSSTGDIERIRLVGDIVDAYNVRVVAQATQSAREA